MKSSPGAAAIALLLIWAPPLLAQNQVAKLQAPDGETGDRFGTVALNAPHAAIGAPRDGEQGVDAGAVYIFDGIPTAPTQVAKLFGSDTAAGDRFGSHIVLANGLLVIGAPLHSHAATEDGAVYVFELEGGVWTETAKLVPGDGAAGDRFGSDVDTDGEQIIVGSPFADLPGFPGSGHGAAYVFQRDGDTWIQQYKMFEIAPDSGHLFGTEVGISGDHAVVGTLPGLVYAFHRVFNQWNYNGFLEANTPPISIYGRILDLNGDRAIVGDPADNGFVGVAYIFRRDDLDWVEEAQLTPSNGLPADSFGTLVSIQDNQALVTSVADTGSAYWFVREGDVWVERAELTGSDSVEDDAFGVGVAIEGNVALCGALFGDGQETDSGTAYVFDLDPLDFQRGDADGNGLIEGLTDTLFVLSYQFLIGSPAPPCLDAADADDDGIFNGVQDGLYILYHAFLGGPPPPAPFPDCGADSSLDAIGCVESACP